METKHTKGPLECTPNGHIYESTPCRAPMYDNPSPKHRDYRCHRLIGSVVSCDVTPEERAANGHLFAAAPELLEACQRLLAVVEAEKEACGIYKAHIELAKDAIAKATK
jgi:hypothetical protein